MGSPGAEQSGPDRCPGCGAAPPPTARFCPECGTALRGGATGARQFLAEVQQPILNAAPARPVSALRPLAVVFLDIVNSSALAARLDPEEYADIVAAFYAATREAVARHGGQLARFVGDGALAYFGFPTADEHDAAHAVRAARETIQRFAERVGTDADSPALRAGVATGLTFVGDVGGTVEGGAAQIEVLGEMPNLAARLQGLAVPGGVVVSNSVRRLAASAFEFASIGEQRIKGWSDPQLAWRVVEETEGEDRLALQGGLPGAASMALPLIGRDAVFDRLLAIWREAQTGRGRAVLIRGEAGVGKSRLVAELCRAAADHLQLRYFAAAHLQDVPLRPMIQRLEQAAGFLPADPPGRRLEKLRGVLLSDDPMSVALIGDLMGIPEELLPPLPPLPPRLRRERLLATLIETLTAAARRGPMLIILEDAHWSDPTSRDLLESAIATISDLPVLLLVTARPEFRPRWIEDGRGELIPLEPLDEAAAGDLARLAVGDLLVPPTVLQQILERADGVPLFIEELCNAVTEAVAQESARAAVRVRATSVPVSLHASLLSRLDRLGPARDVAEVAAVIGREFSAPLLGHVLGWRETELREALDRLAEAAIVARLQQQDGTTTYRFRHALLQDAALGTLTRERLRSLHRSLADVLEEHMAAEVEQQPDLLARHRAGAGQTELAVEWWIRGAKNALRRAAVAEALSQLNRALEVIRAQAESARRAELEIELHLTLVNIHVGTRGYAAPEIRSALDRCSALMDGAGETPLRQVYLRAEWTMRLMSGRVAEARPFAAALLDVGVQRDAPDWLLAGHRSLAFNSYFEGRFPEALDGFDESIRRYDPSLDRLAAMYISTEPVLAVRFQRGMVLALLGRLGAARQEIEEARELADRSGQAYAIILGYSVEVMVLMHAGAFDRARAAAEDMLRLADQHGHFMFGVFARSNLGIVKARTGDFQGGLELARQAVQQARLLRPFVYTSSLVAHEASALSLAGDHASALACFDDVLDFMETSGSRWDEAYLRCQHGEALARAGRHAEAEQMLRQAVAVAEKQQARLWRAQASLALLDLLGADNLEAQALLKASLSDLEAETAPLLDAARARIRHGAEHG